MSSKSLGGLTLTPQDEALFANDSFYLAFAQKDFQAMERLWAKEHRTLCVHPGWPAIIDRRGIMESWERILGNPKQPGIDFYNATAAVYGDDSSVVMVTCYEELPNSICIATNGFVREHGAMRLFHHQSGPCADPPPPIGPSSS